MYNDRSKAYSNSVPGGFMSCMQRHLIGPYLLTVNQLLRLRFYVGLFNSCT